VTPFFAAGNDKEIFRKVLAVDYEVDERISAPAQDLISKILQRNPKQRLTIAGIMIEATFLFLFAHYCFCLEILSHEWLTFSSSSAVGDGQNGPEISSSESIAESFVGESSGTRKFVFVHLLTVLTLQTLTMWARPRPTSKCSR